MQAVRAGPRLGASNQGERHGRAQDHRARRAAAAGRRRGAGSLPRRTRPRDLRDPRGTRRRRPGDVAGQRRRRLRALLWPGGPVAGPAGAPARGRRRPGRDGPVVAAARATAAGGAPAHPRRPAGRGDGRPLRQRGAGGAGVRLAAAGGAAAGDDARHPRRDRAQLRPGRGPGDRAPARPRSQPAAAGHQRDRGPAAVPRAAGGAHRARPDRGCRGAACVRHPPAPGRARHRRAVPHRRRTGAGAQPAACPACGGGQPDQGAWRD